jgi:hypothetical protein
LPQVLGIRLFGFGKCSPERIYEFWKDIPVMFFVWYGPLTVDISPPPLQIRQSGCGTPAKKRLYKYWRDIQEMSEAFPSRQMVGG